MKATTIKKWHKASRPRSSIRGWRRPAHASTAPVRYGGLSSPNKRKAASRGTHPSELAKLKRKRVSRAVKESHIPVAVKNNPSKSVGAKFLAGSAKRAKVPSSILRNTKGRRTHKCVCHRLLRKCQAVEHSTNQAHNDLANNQSRIQQACFEHGQASTAQFEEIGKRIDSLERLLACKTHDSSMSLYHLGQALQQKLAALEVQLAHFERVLGDKHKASDDCKKRRRD